MKEVLNINMLKVPDQSIAAHGLSAGLTKNIPNLGQGFSGFLSEHLNNFINNPINQYNENVNNSAYGPLSWNQEAKSYSNDRLIENQVDLRNEKNLHLAGNETEGSEKNKAIKSANSIEADAVKQDARIRKDVNDNKKDNSVRRKNIDDKPEGANSDEISVLIKDAVIILEMLKGLSPDKKMDELKSALLKLKNSLESLNAGPGKNRFIAANEAEIKKLLEQFKSLIKPWNERVEKGYISHNKNKINTIENKRADNTENKDVKIESVNFTDLKKQITKLTDEIKQYLNNKKHENTISKSDEFPGENKNISSQKVINESLNTERSEGSQARDSASNYHFSNFWKETDGIGSWQKNNPASNYKNSAFSEQLNDIAQNAKIVVRDSKNGSFSIRLHPESLGRVNVNLTLEQGVIIGKFLVESAEAKEVMLENIQAITDRLREDGISVGEFHVNVRDENKSFFDNDYYMERVSHNDPLQALSAGMEYETNSLYTHNGEIDLLI